MFKLKITLADAHEISLEVIEERLTIGRLPDNSVPVEDASVSSHHAELVLEEGRYKLVDLGSTNGTFVNGEQITEHVLTGGESIRFGKVEAVFEDETHHAADKQPLPDSSGTELALGTASARPANFVSASPFHVATKSNDPFSMVAVLCGVLGVLGVAAAVVLSMSLSAGV